MFRFGRSGVLHWKVETFIGCEIVCVAMSSTSCWGTFQSTEGNLAVMPTKPRSLRVTSRCAKDRGRDRTHPLFPRRAEVKRMTGSDKAPFLRADDGTIIDGSEYYDWAVLNEVPLSRSSRFLDESEDLLRMEAAGSSFACL